MADKERRLFFLAWGQVRVLCALYLVLCAPYLVLCAPNLGCRIIVLDVERSVQPLVSRVLVFRVQSLGPSVLGLVFKIYCLGLYLGFSVEGLVSWVSKRGEGSRVSQRGRSGQLGLPGAVTHYSG